MQYRIAVEREFQDVTIHYVEAESEQRARELALEEAKTTEYSVPPEDFVAGITSLVVIEAECE